MKKLLHFCLFATLVCGLSLSVTSCKDDDNNLSEEEKAQEQEEKTSKFWDVVGQLVSSDDYTPDYQDKTFEPTIGYAESEGSLTRIVDTNDMATAARRFADLVDANIDENTSSYTYSDPEVGTLTYTRGGTAEEWASVDVNIKQVPKLRKIIYRVAGEGTNASFDGKAYYRFGDVVSRTVDNQTEYWICVRPAFSIEKKGDSHWVCLNTLPTKNVEHVNKGNKDYYVPTGIDKDKEDMQNFAEMLYAICYPQQWYETADNNHTDGWISFSGVPIFADFTKANLIYHNQYFWENVKQAWTDNKNQIADKVLGYSMDELTNGVKKDGGTGINLLYKGYSWWSLSSWNCSFWQASYTHGTKREELNMHHAAYTEPKKSMQDIEFDCRTTADLQKSLNSFFGNDGKLRWVIRHATGKQLNGGSQPAPTAPLQGGWTEEYVYYKYYPEEFQKTGNKTQNGPEVTEDVNASVLAKAKPGSYIGKDGKFYSTLNGANKFGGGALAMVVFYDDNYAVDAIGYHGLAIALDDVASENWVESRTRNSCLEAADRNLGIGSYAGYTNGILNTRLLSNAICDPGHSHKAAEAAQSLEPVTLEGFSNWFLPGMGQWVRILVGLGIDWDSTKDEFKTVQGQTNKEIISKYFSENGCQPLEGTYWTSTEYDDAEAWCISINVNPFSFARERKDTKNKVRPFIAFDPVGLTKDNGVQKAQAKVGYILAENGKFYQTVKDLYLSGQEGVALVVAANENEVEVNTNYTGLAVALQPSNQQYAWGGDGYICYNKSSAKTSNGCNIYFGAETDWKNGLAITEHLQVDKCSFCEQSHPVFQAAKNFESKLPDNIRQQRGFSQWFVPSTAQYVKMMNSFGATVSYSRDDYAIDGSEVIVFKSVIIFNLKMSEDNFNKMSKTFRMAGVPIELNCWTANRFDSKIEYSDRAWEMALRLKEYSNNNALSFHPMTKRGEKYIIWPMLAF